MLENGNTVNESFNTEAVMVLSDFDLWVEDFIEQIKLHKESASALEEFQNTLRLMIQSYYCSLMSKEEYEEIIHTMYSTLAVPC